MRGQGSSCAGATSIPHPAAAAAADYALYTVYLMTSAALAGNSKQRRGYQLSHSVISRPARV